MNEPLNILIASRGMYESGSTDGIWLKLPATAENLNTALKRIGVNGGEHGIDYFITAFESTIPVISHLPLENIRRAGINELNYIAGQLEKTDPIQLEKLNSSLEAVSDIASLPSLTDYPRNSDYFEHYPNIHNHEQLGKYIYEKSGVIQVPDEWAAAVDLKKLGQLVAAQDKGVFTEKGYIQPRGDIWETFKDIPQDYIIEQKTESQVNEPKRPPPDRMYDGIPPQTTVAAAPIAAMPIVLVSDNSFDKILEITDKLEHGIKGIYESGQYEDYLKTLSKFHTYSSNNCILISMQKPNATHVAGFNTWRDHFSRHVIKGEKGIKILAPAPYKSMRDVDKMTPDGKPIFDSAGKQIKEQIEVTMPSYKVVSVFDVSQTYGEPLPQIGKSELTGNVENYNDFFKALEKASPVPVTFEQIENGAKGYFDPSEKRIALNEGMSELQNLKTMIHEMAHSRLHDRDINAPDASKLPDSRTREIEAESIAYTVCQRYGLDTSDYSFGYIASWSGDKQIDALKSSLDTIRKEANSIITEVDKHFSELQKSKEKAVTADAPKQHHSTAVQMTVDASGKAEPPTAATTTKQTEPSQALKPPQQGENVAAIEAKVKAGETINLSDLSDAMKKDKQAEQSKQAAKTGTLKKTATQEKATKTAKQEKPSIREELAASKRQASEQKSAAKTKSQALEV